MNHLTLSVAEAHGIGDICRWSRHCQNHGAQDKHALRRCHAVVDASSPAAVLMTPERFEDGGSMLLAGLRRRHSFVVAESGIAQQWQEFLLREPIAARVSSNFYGVMCGSDSTGLEYMCSVQVESFDALTAATDRMRVPAQRYAVFAHPARSPLRSTWQEILTWLSGGPCSSAHRPDFELYRSAPDPILVPGGIEVWVSVVARPAHGHPGA